MRLPRPTFGKVLAGTAVVLLATTGTAYAANTVGSDDIIDDSIQSVDIKSETVNSTDILNNSLISADIKNGTIVSNDINDGAVTAVDILDGTIGAADLGVNSVGPPQIATDAVGATEIANDSIDAGEIVDFGLTNQDIGVLFAQVSAAGVLDNSSGGVSVTKLATAGNYEVDFGRDVSSCAFTATIGPSGGGSAAGQVNVADRGGNLEAVFVDTNGVDGSALDRPFSLIVVC